MEEFRAFQPRLWQDDDGVSLKAAPPKPKAQAKTPQRFTWRSCLVVPSLLGIIAGATPLAFRIPEAAAVTRDAATQTAKVVRLEDGQVSAGYWPHLIRAMKTWPRIVEPDEPDPEPEW